MNNKKMSVVKSVTNLRLTTMYHTKMAPKIELSHLTSSQVLPIWLFTKYTVHVQ